MRRQVPSTLEGAARVIEGVVDDVTARRRRLGRCGNARKGFQSVFDQVDQRDGDWHATLNAPRVQGCSRRWSALICGQCSRNIGMAEPPGSGT